MKKLFILLLTVMCIATALTDDFSPKGLISGWKFVPLQVGAGILIIGAIPHKKLSIKNL